MTNTYRIWIDYTNYRGERAWREIVPLRIEFTSNEWRPEKQWLLTAFDVEKNFWRTFAMKDAHAWRSTAPAETVGRGGIGFIRCKIQSVDISDTSHVIAHIQDSTYEGQEISIHRGLIKSPVQLLETREFSTHAKNASVPTADCAAIREALKEAKGEIDDLISYGCPVCSGDCASANPPIISCPVRLSNETMTKLTAALALIGEG